MAHKTGTVDPEIAEMLEFYQAAAARSDSYIGRTLANPRQTLPVQRPVIYHRIVLRHAATISRRER
jgi:hypothetical protein